MKVVFYPDLPKLDPHSQKDETWLVAEPWLSQLVEGRAVLVRKDLETDGASIPRVFWRLIGHPMMQWLLPHALPHDALYAGELLSRKECDDFLLTSMQLAGVSWWRRNAIWSAVRLGGDSVWRRHTKESVEQARTKAMVIDSDIWQSLKRAVDGKSRGVPCHAVL